MNRFKSVFIILLFVSISTIEAQEYFPFPTDTAYWSVYSRKSAWNEPVYEDTFFYFIDGDTLVNNTLYSQLFVEIASSGEIDTANAYPIGGLREENKHVYFKAWENEILISHHCDWWPTLEEVVLFRFDLEEEQTFYLNDRPCILDHIDSVLVDTKYRKRYHVYIEGYWEEYWIEGIGGVRSLFGTFCPTFEGFEALLCYEDPFTFFMGPFNGYGRCTNFIVGLSNRRLKSFSVYPNPASLHLTFEIANVDNCTSLRFECFDLDGKLVYKKRWFDDQYINIDVRKWKRGMYIALLKDEGQIVSKQIFIIN